jgi:hypothetical protein
VVRAGARRPRRSYLDLPNWRRRHWNQAVRAAGLEHRSPYALHHTYASLAIAADISLFELSRFMGTSVSQIDATYGHLLPDALDRTRFALDAFIASSNQIAADHSEPDRGGALWTAVSRRSTRQGAEPTAQPGLKA